MVSLSVTMLIVLSEAYLLRFWPQYEAFLSFQIVNVGGLAPATEIVASAARRQFLSDEQSMPVERSAELQTILEDRWHATSVEDAIEVLALPQLEVTSGKDKVEQIGKLMELQRDLADALAVLLAQGMRVIPRHETVACRL